MSDEQDLKLACLHHAGGDLDHAKALFEWVSGSVRATTDSEAPEVSAPDQDKPEEPFNYRHPSKFGTDIPRRCHLEELTPEERAIRDLVGTVESLGAHPLLTTTVIQLMKAGESLADWVDIELRDKAISALQPLSSGEGGVGLLDGEPEPVPTDVRTQDEQDAAGEWKFGDKKPWTLISAYRDGYEGRKHIAPHHHVYMQEYNFGAAAKASDADIPPAKDAPADQPTIPEGEASDPEIPEGFTKWEGGECPLPLGAHADVLTRKCDVWPIIVKAEAPLLWRHENHDLDIIAYRVPELIEQPETIDDLVRAGFTTWYGGECPVADNVKVEAIDRAGSRYISDEGIATSLNIEWRHFDSSNDIIAYRIIEAADIGAALSGLDSQGIQQDTTEQTEHDRPKLTNEEFESLEKIDGVLDAEPSPILRSEVPPAAETYLAPSGDEFATVNGQTHLIVSDEAEAQGQAETAPQAAYAPIHNEDEPSDAAVFAHGLNVEIDQKADNTNPFNPFKLFGGAKKTLVGEGV